MAIQTGIDAYRVLFGNTPTVDKWTFSTNAVTITGMFQIPTVGFGPGDEVLAHAPNERVPIDDLVTAAAFYAMYAYKI
jgi:acetylornithine deacetylase/succinyl-diaminopimelate desuccinylase-like protein